MNFAFELKLENFRNSTEEVKQRLTENSVCKDTYTVMCGKLRLILEWLVQRIIY